MSLTRMEERELVDLVKSVDDLRSRFVDADEAKDKLESRVTELESEVDMLRRDVGLKEATIATLEMRIAERDDEAEADHG